MRKTITLIGLTIIVTWFVTLISAFTIAGQYDIIGWMATAAIAAIGFVVLLSGAILK